MYGFKKRIEVLEIAVKNRKAELRQHDPFVMFCPWCILLDQYKVFYYPEGVFQQPREYGLLSFSDACALIAEWPKNLSCKISLWRCLEWLFANYHCGELGEYYTQEQLDRFLKDDIEKYPHLAFLLITDEGRELAETLARLPQSCVVRLGNLQEGGENVK